MKSIRTAHHPLRPCRAYRLLPHGRPARAPTPPAPSSSTKLWVSPVVKGKPIARTLLESLFRPGSTSRLRPSSGGHRKTPIKQQQLAKDARNLGAPLPQLAGNRRTQRRRAPAHRGRPTRPRHLDRRDRHHRIGPGQSLLERRGHRRRFRGSRRGPAQRRRQRQPSPSKAACATATTASSSPTSATP